MAVDRMERRRWGDAMMVVGMIGGEGSEVWRGWGFDDDDDEGGGGNGKEGVRGRLGVGTKFGSNVNSGNEQYNLDIQILSYHEWKDSGLYTTSSVRLPFWRVKNRERLIDSLESFRCYIKIIKTQFQFPIMSYSPTSVRVGVGFLFSRWSCSWVGGGRMAFRESTEK